MSEAFPFENLTWPEVAELPRDTPLVIPLGAGYDRSQLDKTLGEPARVGWLPAIPYGWRGSGLEVEADLLGALLANLLAGLQEDGFDETCCLIPEGLEPLRGVRCLQLPIKREAESPLPVEGGCDKVVLIPSGHTEQHAYHLPLSTDTLIIEAIAQGVVREVPDQAVTLPVMPYGVSTHRRAFAGTLNAGGRAYEDFFLGVIGTLVVRGCDRFYLLSGHGGNCSFLTNVVKYAGECYAHSFCATAWLYLSGPQGIEAVEARRRSPIGGMGHAGELETSLMLYLRPDLVHMDRVVDETDFIATPSYYMDWVEGGALVANPPWGDDTKSGAYGAGSLASAEHGKVWLETAIAEKVTHVAEIHAQQQRREARRKAGDSL